MKDPRDVIKSLIWVIALILGMWTSYYAGKSMIADQCDKTTLFIMRGHMYECMIYKEPK